jgi:WW domain-binding protein 2
VELKLTFKEGGAFDFHTNFERVKERLQQAMEVQRMDGNGTSATATLNGANMPNVDLEDLPAYQEESDGPLLSPVSPISRVIPAQPIPTQRDSGVAVEDDRPQPKPSNGFQPPSEPPPGYEEAQRQGVQEEMERRLSEGRD